jgi:hypothetical protein
MGERKIKLYYLSNLQSAVGIFWTFLSNLLQRLGCFPPSQPERWLSWEAWMANVYHPGNMTESPHSYGILSPHIV